MLTPKQKESVRVSFQRGKTNKEISDKTGFDIKDVENVTKALKKANVPVRKQTAQKAPTKTPKKK